MISFFSFIFIMGWRGRSLTYSPQILFILISRRERERIEQVCISFKDLPAVLAAVNDPVSLILSFRSCVHVVCVCFMWFLLRDKERKMHGSLPAA